MGGRGASSNRGTRGANSGGSRTRLRKELSSTQLKKQMDRLGEKMHKLATDRFHGMMKNPKKYYKTQRKFNEVRKRYHAQRDKEVALARKK